MILFNEGDTAGRRNALFRSADPGYTIPAVLSSFAVGEELYNAYTAGQNPTVNLATNGVDVEKLYPNVVAETERGDANHMVLAGAHLDSVPAGPGVNDDGSGTAFQLELAEQLAKAGTPPRNKIRFLWFGGEEDGLVGSQYYAAHLSDAEVARTDMMLDTDMIASPNFARLVYDGDGSTFGSDVSGPAGLRHGRAGAHRLLGRARDGQRADPVRRPLGLRRLHQPRHPGGRRVRRRRGAQDGRSRSPSTVASRASSSTRATTRPAIRTRRSPGSRRPRR